MWDVSILQHGLSICVTGTVTVMSRNGRFHFFRFSIAALVLLSLSLSLAGRAHNSIAYSIRRVHLRIAVITCYDLCTCVWFEEEDILSTTNCICLLRPCVTLKPDWVFEAN